MNDSLLSFALFSKIKNCIKNSKANIILNSMVGSVAIDQVILSSLILSSSYSMGIDSIKSKCLRNRGGHEKWLVITAHIPSSFCIELHISYNYR